ncbi:hypothetical protein BGZ65_010220 [Modicella reniformis]|uniref:N-acetyltransferase domain-containing protein n=1 Tax=Modicella reniformis TaxID=1440133 RepID=A0A9P6J468_9FUNG|nr:hypothetical protein BGZ65_010220 [Modicella reniformis]
MSAPSDRPHYRFKEGVVEVTLSKHATTFYARCEPALMRAAALEDEDNNASSPIQANTEWVANRATTENFSKVLERKPIDPIVHGHCQNVVSVISNILDYHSAERSREGKVSSDEFYCINDIWKHQLTSIAKGDFQIWSKAVKFVINEEDLLKNEPLIRERCERLEREQGLVLGPMVESDIKLMLELNTVQYDEGYGRFMIKNSVCFRTEDGNMVAWAGTHGDFSIAALHVLPAYRSMGLGRLVVNSLALAHVRLAREILTTLGGKNDADVPASKLVAHADCVVENLPTMLFMERCGWHRIGIYLWFELTYKRSNGTVGKDV